MMRPTRNWLYYTLAWIPVAGLYIAALARETPLDYAIRSGIMAIGFAALLGIAVWWLSGRFSWRNRRWFVFLSGQAVFAFVYSTVWTGWVYARIAIGSGRDEATGHALSEGGWWFLTGFWLYGLLAGVSYAIRAERRVIEQREAIAKAETERALAEALHAQAEFRALRARLNPHFLFNTLHSIRSLTQRDPTAATNAIDELGNLLRRVLDLDRDVGEEIPLADELNFVRSYLDLERLRLGDRLTVHEEIAVATLEMHVPPLTLQPLVENAIRHGVAPDAKGGTLRLSAQREGQDLVLRVCDDGRGATPDEVETAPGIGIKAVRGRLESRYPSRGRLDVVTAPGAGFEATVRIPVSASAGVIA